MAQTSVAIGIDLGTSNCCIGYLGSDNHVEIIDNEFGDRTTPSYVAFTKDQEIIGKLAKETVFRDSEDVIYDAKRLIGRRFSDKYLQQNLKLWPFKVVCDSKDDTPLIQISQTGKTQIYKPQDISAKLLKHMKEIAEKRLGKKVESAVITVPAHFNYHQRTATKEAGQLAGLNVLKVINEPTAAALAYIHKREIADVENLLVVDIGGGTLDISVVAVREKNITVKATSGNTYLGGRDFDNNLTQFIVKKIKEQYGLDVQDKKVTMQRIKARSEKLKMLLSYQQSIFFELISMDGNDINIHISRTDFEEINNHLFDSCIRTVENCLTHSNTQKGDINRILLIGGSSRIPKLQHLLKEFFNGNAALTYAINPDEAVAYGAAIQAAIFGKENKTEVELKDVTPLSLGTDTYLGKMSIIIPRNTEIPVTRAEEFFTCFTNQKAMDFTIYEGERGLVEHNTAIGTASIVLPPRPAGYCVEFLCRLDENGILEVDAKLDTGAYAQLEIQYKKRVKRNINDILQDAVENRTVDNNKLRVFEKFEELREYCERMKSIYLYKTKHISENDINLIIKPIVKDTSTWLSNHKMLDGTIDENDAIFQKQTKIEAICEPILKKYGFGDVKDMSNEEFYNFAWQS